MHILFLTQILPYPPDAGPKVKTWHVLRYLVEQGHQVTLISFTRPEEMQHISTIEAHGIVVHSVPIRRSRVADVGYMILSYLKGQPFLVLRDGLAQMYSRVREVLAMTDFDLVHADQLTMAQFAIGDASFPPVIFDAHNAVWTIVDRMRDTAPFFLKPVLAVETQRVKKYEGLLLEKVACTLAVTSIDREALLAAWRSVSADRLEETPRVEVIPIAVDTGQLQPVMRKSDSQNILTLGTLHYPPNADGIRWFANEVFPLVKQQVPGVTLTIVGKNPPQDFLQMAEQGSGIHVTGYVPDLLPCMEDAAVLVVPVRAGGGMRVRILEAFAFAMPVVTTTVGLEGIEANIGGDVLVEDSPVRFANAVARLLKAPAIADQLGAQGRVLAETRYDWQKVLRQVEQVYHGFK